MVVVTKKLWLRIWIFCLVGLLASDLCFALDGMTLARKVYERDVGKDSQARVRMLLINKRGKKRFRTMVMAVKDYGSVSKSLSRFISPANIEGTAFLTWENEDRDDDQFLYLPALKRVRRIVSSQKSNRFVNTDYTYEDLQSRQAHQDRHKILRSEKYNKYDCWVLESTPVDMKATQYGKRRNWIVKDIYVVIKTEFYDKKGRLKKIYKGKKIKKVQGIWSVMESSMEDLKKKHRTLMKTSSIRYNQNIPDKVFTKGYMKHLQ